MSYFLSPYWILPTSVRRGIGFFQPTATSGLTRGGVHPKIWVLFFLGGHCHELFLSPPLDFYHKFKEGRWIFPPNSDIGAHQGRGAP